MNERQIIRQEIRLKRQQLSSTTRLQASLEISRYIINTLWFRRSHRIAFYQAVRGEIDPSYLVQHAWKMHKTCYLPVCHPVNQKSLFFMPYSRNDSLKLNRYNILEPGFKKRGSCKPFTLDIVFTPLIAFDNKGNRLGSGKGYYDRTFAYLRRLPDQSKPMLVGLAYGFQAVEQLHVQPWDIPMNKIIAIDPSSLNLKIIEIS